ncbi:MAG: RnfH family protein [Porticoccaceae bacterium]
MSDKIKVEVAYATPEKQKILAIMVEPGTTAEEAVAQSGIDQHFPDVDMASAPKGVFGNALGTRGMADARDYVMKEGDRVEIYRPLIADPKEVRKQRAAEAAGRKERSKES